MAPMSYSCRSSKEAERCSSTARSSASRTDVIDGWLVEGQSCSLGGDDNALHCSCLWSLNEALQEWS